MCVLLYSFESIHDLLNVCFMPFVRTSIVLLNITTLPAKVQINKKANSSDIEVIKDVL